MIETAFTPWASLGGGALIGLAAVLLMGGLGRIMGATGILAAAILPGLSEERGWRVAMILGMLLGLVLFVPLGILFGAMEVMVPIMFSGMLGGMVVGMWAAMAPLSGAGAAVIGGVCGLIGINVIWILNNSLRGQRDATAGH